MLFRLGLIRTCQQLWNAELFRALWRSHNLRRIRAQGRKQRWESQLEDELAYWDSWIATEGRASRGAISQLAQRLDPNLPLQDYVAERLSGDLRKPVRILDVGSGPLTSLGKVSPGREIQITAVDPLADAYVGLLARHDIEAPVAPLTAQAEDLGAKFPENSFDVVHAANAIDHCHDAVQAIRQMIQVAKPGGCVILVHTENEAERQCYAQLHQWNFELRGGDFFTWSDNFSRNLSEEFRPIAMVEAWRSDGKVYAALTKRPCVAAQTS